MQDLIVQYQWNIFITAEILSLLALLLFGAIRYLFGKKRLSLSFLILFLLLLAVEAGAALIVYQQTGEIETFQIVVFVFIIYACTFGIWDFKKLDRWMRDKIGNVRKVDLLTDKDREIMQRQKDPKYIAKKYRYSSIVHLAIFVIVQCCFWYYGTNGDIELMLAYLKDPSWMGQETAVNSPYPNATLYEISHVWGIIFAIDFIYSWSFTFFPPKR